MKSVGPSLAPTNAKGIFVVADVTIKNKGKEALTIDSSMFKLKSGDKTFEADNTGSMSANQSDNGSIENSFFLQRINPDSTAQGKIVFDVSENIANAKDKKLEVISTFISVKITFDLSDAKKTSKAKKDKQDTEVAVASSNSDNVNYEASATTPATTSSADTDSEDSEKSSKDEDKQNASKSDKSSVEKSESNEETATVEPVPRANLPLVKHHLVKIITTKITCMMLQQNK